MFGSHTLILRRTSTAKCLNHGTDNSEVFLGAIIHRPDPPEEEAVAVERLDWCLTINPSLTFCVLLQFLLGDCACLG